LSILTPACHIVVLLLEKVSLMHVQFHPRWLEPQHWR